MDDNINHPKHYNASPAKCICGRRIECIDVTQHMNFNLGNALKYIWRSEHKGGLEDLQKAIWYLKNEISRIEPRLQTDQLSMPFIQDRHTRPCS